ncbi:hypothetical protein Bca52824_039305 [Brassica carinata]|uniref:Uncharacterized protein n=1 Tax=Brassica carinata TaxID=52824 RepID=A0A8X7UWS2_BRACI|nr:hypothetical protein Bca52824_039305 [Brassica carinata]
MRVVMAISRIFFSDLKSSKCFYVVEPGLLRFWDARNVKRGGELMWIDTLLMDVNDLSPHISLTLSRSIEGSINRDIDFRSDEDHPNDDMTGAVNPSMDSNPIVNNIGPDNTNQCDTTATIEGCS